MVFPKICGIALAEKLPFSPLNVRFYIYAGEFAPAFYCGEALDTDQTEHGLRD